MRTEIKGILLPAAAIVLIIAALIGAAFADRALNATEKEPRLDIRFFRSGDGFFILFVCGGVAAVACPYDGDGAGTVASSLKNRMIEKADLLICPDEATAERMKKLLGNYAEQAETVTDIKGEREFSLDTAKLSVKYEGSAYYIRAEHAENTFALCGGDVTFDGFSRNASGADTVTIPITLLNDEKLLNFIENADMSRVVVCEDEDQENGDIFDALRDGGVKYISTAYGNVGIRSERGAVQLVPDDGMTD